MTPEAKANGAKWFDGLEGKNCRFVPCEWAQSSLIRYLWLLSSVHAITRLLAISLSEPSELALKPRKTRGSVCMHTSRV